jgi:hypothetical protein
VNFSHNLTVRGNVLDTATSSGMYILNGWVDSRFEWNTVVNSRTDVAGGWQGGALVFQANGGVIENNVFGDTRPPGARTQDHGVLIYPGPVSDLVVRYNQLDDHVESGIGTGTTNGPLNNLRVYENQAHGNGAYGLRIIQGSSGQSFSACSSANDFSGNSQGDVLVDIPLPACSNLPASRVQITTTATLPAARVGVSWSSMLEASGGTPPYTWSAVAGGLPRGVKLDASSGQLSGTPTTPGRYQFVVYAYDTGNPAQSSRRELEQSVLP